MDVRNEMHKTQVMQLAGKNISAIFLGVKTPFDFASEGSYAMTSKLPQS